tara:strand:+ start:153 stop:1058 length:906 start_codon:yes stop_codon:yes gene_type:complete
MIKLKELLDESVYVGQLENDKWYPAHTRAALQWTLVGDYVPLYPKQMESLFGKIPVNAFHVTNPSNIKSVSDILGKKKSISTFTKANKSSQLAKGRGVQTGSGGVIFYVEGLMLARKYMDFDTVPDKSGIRWVKGHHVFDGDHMIVRSAIKKAKLYDYDTWRDMENRVSDKYEMSDYDSYKDYNNAIKKELGVVANKQIKKYIDTTNKLLKKYKDVVQQSLRKPSKETSAWWNEVLIYKTKVIDAFVLKRVWDDYYFKNDSYDTTAYKKDLLKIVPENKITIGTPAQFRKWYTKREGEITI